MTSRTNRSGTDVNHLRRGVVVAVALMVGAFGFNACSLINKVKTAIHDIRGNKATIDAFNSKLQSGGSTTFEATYVTSGSSPATVVYAVQPPKGLAFADTPTGGSGSTSPVHLVVNQSGEYACNQPSASGTGSSTQWTCDKLGAASASVQNQIFDFYTPSHWIGFLRDFSLAAGFAGDKVTSSTMTVNGFDMNCVDFVAAGVPGKSTICTTAQGILGYVKVASDATSFAIKSYTTSPPASLFELPPGAKVTSNQNGSA
ncbi:MAG TPA: hypothetical protein VND70_11110 [Acidimicrobiales bacterium]|nr:hypothetical protein [Acidimicrobiales bacterium]